ncbi:LytR family transcriptional regulator [Nocardioides sp. zg-579]|uniref:LytR family transcriptional regulator n=1 Tax=Nocardioides marmotae TaxID=2663857 RepID=A0A6I3JDE9_9ACTN|nr:LytR C-terminal domain-containing protein [Nocardioides marmotae]MCR6032473.1 LytR family transcriptional regulator [Gordonia jinghuaiqii]MTB96122.1 LytR family transcriptional regulator [Nocardioides marmotae]QKD99800.1 LytR C-terminal domain-containing protein [Nocardioides marmotae]
MVDGFIEGLDRRVRTLVTLGVLALLLVLGAAWGWSAATKPFPGAVETATCVDTDISEGSRLFADQVVVNVLNAGGREGLAGQTMQLFADAGFVEGETGNAPRGTEVDLAQVWAPTKVDPAVRLVLTRLGPGAEFVRQDVDEPGVTVVVGDGFEELAEGKESVRVGRDTVVCSPPE